MRAYIPASEFKNVPSDRREEKNSADLRGNDGKSSILSLNLLMPRKAIGRTDAAQRGGSSEANRWRKLDVEAKSTGSPNSRKQEFVGQLVRRRLRRINVSIDTLPSRSRQWKLTRRRQPGIFAAKKIE